MIPQNRLSTEIIAGPFLYGRAMPVTRERDWETGGIAIQDPSQGLNVQIWKARLEEDVVYLSAPTVPEFEAFTAPDLEEISFTFDQNMRFTLAYVQSGQARLYWYDSQVSQMVITDLPTGSITPRITMDDKRDLQSAVNDIILCYVNNGTLYFRQQRDRFQTEYQLATDLPAGIVKIGMNRRNRLQILTEVM